MIGTLPSRVALAAILASSAAWATDNSHEERMRAGMELRIDKARRHFDDWVARTPGPTQAKALVSFASHVPPRRIRDLLLGCGCEPLQLYRTVGEMQYGVGGDASRVLDANDADRVLGADLAATIAFELTNAMEAPGLDETPGERSRMARAKAERQAVADEASRGRPRFTGVSVRATRDGLQWLRRNDDVLAIEITTGGFPLPVDLLDANHRPPPRPKP